MDSKERLPEIMSKLIPQPVFGVPVLTLSDMVSNRYKIVTVISA